MTTLLPPCAPMLSLPPMPMMHWFAVPVWKMSLEDVRTMLVKPAGQHPAPPAGQKPVIPQTAGVPVHVPPWQLCELAHTLPTLQGVPLALGGFEHAPVDV